MHKSNVSNRFIKRNQMKTLTTNYEVCLINILNLQFHRLNFWVGESDNVDKVSEP